MKKISLAVLFGGVSNEYEVSLLSAQSILEHLDAEKYDVIKIGITRQGAWFLYEGDIGLIAQDAWCQPPWITPALITPDRKTHGLLVLSAGGTRVIPLEMVFPVLHGRNGEDGTMQGLLELAGIPYVGSGVLSSAGCMDKAFTHCVLQQNGIPGTRYLTVSRSEMADFPALLGKVERSGISYPLFVKPANGGSSLGISKAHGPDELAAALQTALNEDSKALLEETVDGIEVECAVMGGDTPIASDHLGEIEPLRELYDYEGKYRDDTAILHIPARIPQQAAQEIRRLAVAAYKIMDCRGLARVDFFVRRDDGRVVLNEINTLPGFTNISMFPKLFCAQGMAYGALLDRLIDDARTMRGVTLP